MLAIKIIQKNKNSLKKQEKKILKEANILKQLNHPNILKIYEILNDD